MNAIFENIRSRRSIRAFTDQEIPKQELETIVEAGRWAPTGKNVQTFRFTVVRNQQKIQNLAKAIAPHFEWTRGKNYNFYGPKVLIMVSDTRENTNGISDCACALENMFLMAHELGIGSCWINQLKYICDEPDIRPLLDELEIPSDHIVWGMAALGYAAKPASMDKLARKSEVKYID